MMKKRDARGMSTIVAVLLIILLTLVAIAILWVVIRTVIKQGAEQVSLGKFTLNLEIKNVAINPAVPNYLDVRVKRNPGEGEIYGIKLIMDDGDTTEVFELNNFSLKELEERTINVSLNSITNASNIQKISIAPIFRLESGREITGDVKDEYEVPKSSISGGGTGCTPNCAGRVCGPDPVCGQSCGTCTTGTCNSSGQCVVTCTDTCSSLGYVCGTHTICGVSTNCGTCTSPAVCNSSGQCVTTCTPATCSSLGKSCGTWANGTCGGTLNCGTCTSPAVCNSSGQCVVTCTDTCSSLGYQCNIHTICGVSTNCGNCTGGQTCNATGQCVSSGSTWTWTGELTVNGGFEFNNLTGWTISGTGAWRTGNHPYSGSRGPQAGSYCAFEGNLDNTGSVVGSYLYQDVDLTAYAGYIDTGNALVNASGWGVSSETCCDITRIQIIFLNSGKGVISTPKDTGGNVTSNWWKAGIYGQTIPANTRYVRIWGSTQEEPWDSGSIDSFSVKVGYLG